MNNNPLLNEVTVAYPPNRQTILGILCGSLVLVVVSVSSLNVAIPDIQRSLDASGTELQWIIDSYALVFAGLLLPAGAIGDRFGRREALLAGLGVFTIAALGGTLADTAAELIAARALMGAGAALIMPATLSIVSHVFPIEERAKAIAVWAGFAGAGGVVGLLSSGVLLESYWWGSVFLVNVPIAVLMIALVVAWVPTSRDPDATRLDPVGALLSIGGLVALVFGIIEGPEKGWTGSVTVTAFVVAVVLLVAFVGWELRTAHPMLDPRYFRIREFSLGSLVITVTFFGLFGMFFVVIQFLQFVQGHGALAAGVRMLPYGVLLVLVSPRSALLAARFGNRATVVGGTLLASAGFVALGFLRPDSSYTLLASGLVLLAVGTGLLMPPATAALVGSLPEAKAGVGSAMNDTTREVGGAIGIAVIGALVSVGYRSSLGDSLAGADPHAEELASDSIGGLFAVAESFGPDASRVIAAGSEAFADGVRLGMWTAAGALALAAVAIAVLHPSPANTQEEDPHV